MNNDYLLPCACSRLRSASRAVSAFYDRHLASAGLTVTQYALLAAIGRNDGISRSQLAELVKMERTTLTRNLLPLERCGLLQEETLADRRAKGLKLSRTGRAKLQKARPLWIKAQEEFRAALGEEKLTGLHGLLQQAEDAANWRP